VKFVLFVEGHTEKALPSFLGRWLNPQLKQPIGIQAVQFDGAADMIKDMPARAERFLNAPKQDVIAVIGLLDLYGLPLIIPASQKTVTERCAWAKVYLEEQVGHPKFKQFFAVHETEAWLLSQPGIFSAALRTEIVGRAQHPETINNQEPPGKLQQHLYRTKTRSDYKKTVDGANLFADLDPAVAYEKCPHLKTMLDDMLSLARYFGL